MAVIRTQSVLNPGAVKVAVSTGEFLHFILDAGGPIPIFSFASNVKGNLFEPPDFPGHPMARYEWVHLRNPSDIQQLELLNLVLSFMTNSGYTYTVELRNATGLTATVMQITYTGASTDIATESLRVVIA